MKIICPTCNKSYNIPDDKIPKNGARGKCKGCGGIIVIERTGTVWGETTDRETGLNVDHGMFLDYPELQGISEEKVAFEEILSRNKKGGYKGRKNKFKVRILTAVSEVLDKVLNNGEKVMRIGKGTAYYPAELIFGNGWLTMMYNHYAILATNQRLLFININSKMKRTTHYLFQMLYEDIKKVRRGLLFGSMVFYRLESKRRVFNNVKRFISKELREFIIKHEDYGEGYEQEVLENICPACFTPQKKGLSICTSCKAPFKTPGKASLRSLLLPGLGDIYLGHRALGILELIGSLMVWIYGLVLILSGVKDGLFIAAVLLLFYNCIDAAVTYFMAKKGYMLA